MRHYRWVAKDSFVYFVLFVVKSALQYIPVQIADPELMD